MPTASCCDECGSTKGLQPIVVLDCSDEDDMKDVMLTLCAQCMEEYDLCCGKHGPKMCMHSPPPDDVFNTYYITKSCLGCAKEKVLDMDPKEIRESCALIAQYKQDELPFYAESPVFGRPSGLTRAELIVFNVLVMAELHEQSLKEAILEIITDTPHVTN